MHIFPGWIVATEVLKQSLWLEEKKSVHISHTQKHSFHFQRKPKDGLSAHWKSTHGSESMYVGLGNWMHMLENGDLKWKAVYLDHLHNWSSNDKCSIITYICEPNII